MKNTLVIEMILSSCSLVEVFKIYVSIARRNSNTQPTLVVCCSSRETEELFNQSSS